MSIINDALKKTGERLKMNTAKTNPLPANSLRPKTFLFYILILLAGLLLANFIFTLLKHRIKINQAVKKDFSAATPTKNLVPLSILPNQPLEINKPTEASFILNGIFFSDNNSYALINNQIVRENDSVDGAKVKTISLNTVELNRGGKTITLMTQK